MTMTVAVAVAVVAVSMAQAASTIILLEWFAPSGGFRRSLGSLTLREIRAVGFRPDFRSVANFPNYRENRI